MQKCNTNIVIRTNFSDCLNSALLQSGKSLGQVQSELQAKGFRVNKSTLNRWCNGLSTPRRDKLALLRYLPDLLDMRPALRSVFNRIVNQMVGGPLINIDGYGRFASHQNFLGGPVVYFTGRSSELEQLKNAVNKRQTVLITGLGGVGKTSLGRKLLEEMAGDFSFGCEAIAIKPDQSAGVILEQIARRLGIPFSTTAAGQEFDRALQNVRDWTHNIDLLFLLDDVYEGNQVRQIVSELIDITWVITSRRKLFLPSDFVEVALMPPPPDEAVSMLLYYCNLSKNSYESVTAHEIVSRLGSLPIALKTAGGLVQTHYLPNLSSLLIWLDERGLDGVRLDDWRLTDFLAGLLEMVGENGRHLFALCGVFPTSQIDLPVITALAAQFGLAIKELGQLANLSLVEWQVEENQIQLHPLIYEYAVSYLAAHPNREEITFHFAGYYAALARKFHKEIQRLEPELTQLLTAANIACEAMDWPLLQPLWQVVSTILWRMSDWETYRGFDEECLKVARKAGERHVESRILSELGWVFLEEGKWETADEYFQKAQFIVDDLTSTQHSVRLRRYRAIMFTELGQLDKAAILLAEAEHLIEKTGEMALWPKQAREQSLSLIYHAYAGLARAGGDYETALARERQAIESLQNEESYHFRPMFQLQLGDIYYYRNDLEKAGNIWQKIIRHGSKYQPEQRIIAAAFLRMAQLAAFRGNRDRAGGWANRARQLYKESGLGEKMRQAAELADGLGVLMDDPPEVWPAFELWD